MSDLPDRRRLFALAYRMLGSRAEAEDVLQDAWLRWQGVSDVRSPSAWLTTTVTRLCLDQLKSARLERETYVGPWLPEPIATHEPELDAESVSLAFLAVLERLTPAERAVFLLHDVFDYSHAEIAETLGLGEANVRKLRQRAKEHLALEKPRFAPTKERHAEILLSFAAACQNGELSPLRALLAEGARAYTDGGGKARAARKVVFGRDRVARLLHGLGRKGGAEGIEAELSVLNGWPALILRRSSGVFGVLAIETDGHEVFSVHLVLNPDKLGSLAGEAPS